MISESLKINTTLTTLTLSCDYNIINIIIIIKKKEMNKYNIIIIKEIMKYNK